MSTPALMMQPGLPPAVRRVRGYFAPVNRTHGHASRIRCSNGSVL